LDTSVADPKSEPRRPSSLLLGLSLAAILVVWSFNYIAAKIALRHMDGLSLASFRMEFAAMIMLPLYLIRGRPSSLRPRDLWIFAYLGFFGIVINQGCFILGLSHTTSQHSVIIIALDPILVLLLAVAMKLELLTPAKIFGMGISLVGVLLLETERGSPAHSPLLLGDFITLAGATGYSIYAVLGKKVVNQYDAFTLSAGNVLASAIIISPLAIRQAIRLNWPSVGWEGWAGMIYMAIFSSIIAYTLFYWVLRYMEASRVSAVNYVQPVVVIILASVILGERASEHLLIGGVLVLIGVYIIERNVDLPGFTSRQKQA
jgi:drug/metabolite transporter (DMT)-like permease